LGGVSMLQIRDRAGLLQLVPAAPHRVGVDAAEIDERGLRLVGVIEEGRLEAGVAIVFATGIGGSKAAVVLSHGMGSLCA
jgi:hypothetical protein